MRKTTGHLYEKDFWLKENLRYSEPYFRLEKCARIVNALAQGMNCDLLDVGCGPATLARLLQKNINYFGVDIAIHDPVPNLLELDFAQNEIEYGSRCFDIVVATGVFEYLGGLQHEKFAEVQRIIKRNGKLVLTYSNFGHLNVQRAINGWYFNNIQPIQEFKEDLESFFHVEKWFPSSHNWFFSESRRKWLRQIQMPLETSIPIISRMLAISYFFICSLKK